mmetsp:Transcript_26505/g.37316  ORF Transcript_26505/g.37316 Transcript_26505/m.37316 type:complete len:402 (+) Transcript_26505:164-1369(+)
MNFNSKFGQSRLSKICIIAILINVIFFWFVLIGWASSNTGEPNSQKSRGSSFIQTITGSRCSSIQSESECRNSDNCKPIVGTLCSSTGSTTYFGCADKTEVIYDWSPQVCISQNQHASWMFNNAHPDQLKSILPFPYEVTDCSKCMSHPPLSVIVLCWNELLGLENSLKSWQKGGLLDYAAEVIVYFQEINQTKVDLVEKYNDNNKIKVIGTEKNRNVGFALSTLVRTAQNEHVLFLEKDWELVEPCKVAEQLNGGLDLLVQGVADQVKYRSRMNAGYPNWAEILYKDKEDNVFNSQPNLLCNFYHWIGNPDCRWPDKFTVCWRDPKFYCVNSYYCNWTNNPSMFSKTWWMKNLDSIARGVGEDHVHNWEGLLNSDWSVWNNKNFIIASGDGLFTHHEIDG